MARGLRSTFGRRTILETYTSLMTKPLEVGTFDVDSLTFGTTLESFY